MVAEEVVITLSGGAPWGFRLQGGVEHHKPLQVAKVRKRSKACRAELREADELVSINDQPCSGLSHAQAMTVIDSSSGILHIRVKRAPAGFQSVVLLTRAPSPRIDKEYRAVLRAMSPSAHPNHPPVREVHHSHSRSSLLSPTGRSGLTSPPGSEAYYGETDSDADVAAHERQRRQKRRSPNNPLPGKPPGRASAEGGETSEMSGYDSAPDARVYPGVADGRGGEGGLSAVGVARREVIYQPPPSGMWSSQTSTETSSIISSADDQGPPSGGPEEDSGFQELTNVPPLVSPERAKEAMMLGSRGQLVPMVGPLETPLDEDLTTTYMDKAKQAKLNRGDTLQDKQVKEARTKCRTIASLLTDAPNPHSKGVLMFKKRRQRSKKYTLTSFGSVDEDLRQDSQEEDGAFLGSESEFDEDGFSAAPDSTWDGDYLDVLEKRATAATTAAGGRGDGADDAPSPGLSDTAGKGAQLFEQQRKRAAEHARKVEAAQPQAPPQPQPQSQSQIGEQPNQYPPSQSQPDMQFLQTHQPPPPASFQDEAQQLAPPIHSMANGNMSYSVVSTASMVMSPPVVAPKPATASVTILTAPAPLSQTPLPELSSSSVLNRTAQPFAPGFVTNRAATAPVVFRPTVTKKPQRPATSAGIVPTPFSASSELAANMAPLSSLSQPSIFSPPPSVAGGPFSPSSTAPRYPAFSTPLETTQAAQPMTMTAPHLPVSAPVAPMPQVSAAPMPQMAVTASQMNHVPVSMAPMPPPPQMVYQPPQVSVAQPSQVPVSQPPPMAFSQPPSVPRPPPPTAPVSVVPQATTVAPTPIPTTPMSPPGGRTGILLDARRRSGRRPMFRTPEDKKNSPNPELLNMVQNLDDRPHRGYGRPPSVVMGYEGGEEDNQDGEAGRGRMPPPVAPKPRVIHETPLIPQNEGKGAQLFARRQSRMDLYVVDTPPETPFQQEVHSMAGAQDYDPSSNPSLPNQWKYSPNIRAPPPIGYNPLLAPSCPVGPQRDTGRGRGGPGGMGSQREGIKALDFMRRQPYQLNSGMFSYGGSVANLSAMPSYQAQRQQQQQQQGGYTMVGSSLTPPKQIPIKAARVYEIKRFSTPTPMSAPTLATKVIAQRSATTLGEPIMRSDMTSPTPTPISRPTAPPTPSPFSAPTPTPFSAPTPTPFNAPHPTSGLPSLPQISAIPIPNSVPVPHPTPYTGVSYTGLQAAKQFQSAPELSLLGSLPPLRATPIQVPKPRFIATKSGIKPHIWRPGAM
ncbi:synaptopodin 2-like protein [Osmerus mordax]|uniref:synaptopodin 2-like protein n=1 Tax=Osmerus mordax TaxID=8014 RepID=UPI00350F78E4